MKKAIIAVVGPDRPGILAAVSGILFKQDCNIENISQTILQSEFAGIFIVSIPMELDSEQLENILNNGLALLDLHVHLKLLEHKVADFSIVESEPFVITSIGPDREGLVASITGIMARYGVNVTNLQAVFKGGDMPGDNIMIYEVDVPQNIDHQDLHQNLKESAEKLGLQINIQHRKIFEAINRI